MPVKAGVDSPPLADDCFACLDSLDHPDHAIRQRAYSHLLSQKNNQILHKLYDIAENGSDSARYYAYRLLSGYSGNQVKSFLLEQASCKDAATQNIVNRRYALETLRAIGINHDHLTIVFDLLSDPVWELRRLAAEILAAHGGQWTEEILELLRSEAPEKRYWAARIIQELLGPESLAHIKPLYFDSFWFIRAHAAVTAGEYGDSDEIPELEKLLDDSNEFVVAYAREAMESIQKRSRPQTGQEPY